MLCPCVRVHVRVELTGVLIDASVFCIVAIQLKLSPFSMQESPLETYYFGNKGAYANKSVFVLKRILHSV